MAMTDKNNAKTNADNTIKIIKEYLQAMEDRDLAGAANFLADEFQMHFPGDQTLHTLDELVAWSKPRYKWVKKAYEQFDICPAGKESCLLLRDPARSMAGRIDLWRHSLHRPVRRERWSPHKSTSLERSGRGRKPIKSMLGIG